MYWQMQNSMTQNAYESHKFRYHKISLMNVNIHQLFTLLSQVWHHKMKDTIISSYLWWCWDSWLKVNTLQDTLLFLYGSETVPYFSDLKSEVRFPSWSILIQPSNSVLSLQWYSVMKYNAFNSTVPFSWYSPTVPTNQKSEIYNFIFRIPKKRTSSLEHY